MAEIILREIRFFALIFRKFCSPRRKIRSWVQKQSPGKLAGENGGAFLRVSGVERKYELLYTKTDYEITVNAPRRD
ncbi:MAG: hypothetical protein Q4A04_02195 [Eubacteriales bacterium]|nr:hypothetical protein [Eubacteriales bacterium]